MLLVWGPEVSELEYSFWRDDGGALEVAMVDFVMEGSLSEAIWCKILKFDFLSVRVLVVSYDCQTLRDRYLRTNFREKSITLH